MDIESETFARVHLRFFRQLRQGDRLGVSTSTLSFFIISASMASALLAPQLSLSTAADKLLECPEPLVPSGTDMRSTEVPLDVKCLASEVEQSAAAALLGLCTSTAQSMEGSTDSSPASPARDDSESFRFNTMPGLLNSWDSAPSSSTGSPRPRNSKDGMCAPRLPNALPPDLRRCRKINWQLPALVTVCFVKSTCEFSSSKFLIAK
jgi:hypothetical protein